MVAESALWDAGLTHKKRKERRDRVAAQMMLQAYLDCQRPPAAGVEALRANAYLTDPQLREIQGYLDALEQLNHGPDRECCFEFERVEWRGDLQSSLEAHFETLPGAHPHWQLTLETLATGLEGLRPVVEAWFFGPTFGGTAGLAKQVDGRRPAGLREPVVQFSARTSSPATIRPSGGFACTPRTSRPRRPPTISPWPAASTSTGCTWIVRSRSTRTLIHAAPAAPLPASRVGRWLSSSRPCFDAGHVRQGSRLLRLDHERPAEPFAPQFHRFQVGQRNADRFRPAADDAEQVVLHLEFEHQAVALRAGAGRGTRPCPP